MPMMAEMRYLFQNGVLDENQEIYFSSPQHKDELYDLQNDPYELNNLAEKEIWKDTLKHYSHLLDRWIRHTGDQGEIPEKELIQRWLIDGGQPKLPIPEIFIDDQKITIASSIEHATIIWRGKAEEPWKIYTEPIPADDFLMAKITAIGYEDSESIKN